MKRLVAILAVCLAAITAGAVTLETGRIKVETGGEYPILKYDQNPAFSFEVRAWGKGGWWVRSSAVRGECFIYAAEVGEQVLDYPFDTYHCTSYDSSPNVDVFRFQFRWKHTFGTESGGTATLMHYGWVSLVTNGAGEVCVLASQVADFHAEAVVGQGEPNPPVAPEDPVEVEWSYHVVKDSWVELDPLCIPETTAGAIEIPSEIEGKPVKVISEAAFIRCDRVTSILIPDTVERIDSRAFSGCNALTSLTIPSSVTNVGHQIANNSTNLTYLTIRHNASAVYEDKAFARTFAKYITIEEGLTRIGNRMFLSSVELEEITIPKSVERIEAESFLNSPKLKTAYVFVGTTIESGAFPSGCRIVRYGPTISAYMGKLRAAEAATLLRILGTPDVEKIYIHPDWDHCEQDGDKEFREPDDAATLCVKLGISPFEISNDKGRVEAKFRAPSVKIVAFDPAAGKVAGKVIPAAGTRIAEPPMSYAFGLNYWEYFGQPYQYIKPLGWEWPYDEHSDIKLDLSRYMETGEFTYTYPLWYPLDDCPSIFSVVIGDYNEDREID